MLIGMQILHIPTPGDHFSPLTGSAVITVIHELSQIWNSKYGNSNVSIAKGTYLSRYSSATIHEYELNTRWSKSMKYKDALLGLCGKERRYSINRFQSILKSISALEATSVIHNYPSVAASPLLPKHSILYCHNELFRSYLRREIKQSLDSWSGIIFVSDYLRNRFLDRFPFAEYKTATVRNGVNTRSFSPIDSHQLSDEVSILFVGRVVYEKGVDILIKALKPLVGYKLTIVGRPGFDPNAPLSKYEIKLRRQSVGMPVTFLNFTPRSDLPAVYRSSDVLVVPSRFQDPFPLTVLEGMSSGLPTVAANVGGINEIHAGDALSLFPKNNVSELRHILEFLIHNHSQLNKLGMSARKVALENDWEKSCETLFETLTNFKRKS